MAFKRNLLVVVVQGALIVAALSSASPAQLTVVKTDARKYRRQLGALPGTRDDGQTVYRQAKHFPPDLQRLPSCS